MKLMHEQLNLEKKSVTVKWDDFEHFTFPWHFHPEYEIVYIVRSFGKRFVGDRVDDFNAGDLVLLGSNLPHFWRNDELFYQNNHEYWVNALVIHFPPDFFQHSIAYYPEFAAIRNLLNLARRGLSFGHAVSDHLASLLYKIRDSNGLARTLLFIQALDIMAHTTNCQTLASESYQNNMENWSSNRLTKALHWINANYRKQASIEEVAEAVGMNTSAFSRYFKEKTGKTFSGFVNEMRTGFACRLIQDGNKTITQTCFESGFNNIANFNRQFKKIMSVTPSEYSRQFAKKV
ncbi:MAG: AraC family transcriptional regulator [Bacteroidales bacterium]|jgi:AraC-like DNA-binding protein|nr:AraC family transcriptional regulator [Bacteroidales bacterium]